MGLLCREQCKGGKDHQIGEVMQIGEELRRLVGYDITLCLNISHGFVTLEGELRSQFPGEWEVYHPGTRVTFTTDSVKEVDGTVIELKGAL